MTGALADELRYMERKHFISPVRVKIKQREVREYGEADTRMVRLIMKYRRMGFTWDVAHGKASGELANPPLFEVH